MLRKQQAVRAAQEMRVGPSKPLYRRRLQTATSCDGKEPWWWALWKRQGLTLSGEYQGDERKWTFAEVSKAWERRQNRGVVVISG